MLFTSIYIIFSISPFKFALNACNFSENFDAFSFNKSLQSIYRFPAIMVTYNFSLAIITQCGFKTSRFFTFYCMRSCVCCKFVYRHSCVNVYLYICAKIGAQRTKRNCKQILFTIFLLLENSKICILEIYTILLKILYTGVQESKQKVFTFFQCLGHYVHKVFTIFRTL